MEDLTNLLGLLYEVPIWASIISIAVVAIVFAYSGAPLWAWTLLTYVCLAGYNAPLWTYIAVTVIAAIFLVKPIRRVLVTGPLMKLLDAMHFLPTISETEQAAIESGTVWIDGELFSGKPNFKKILSESYPDLTKEERDFLDGPVEALCSMVNDWDVFVKKDFVKEAWDLMKNEGFFGLIIPKSYGGKEFSATAHSYIITKLSSRCGTLATTVMVPNSLGPAELLLHYGTQEQKDYYLPRLAKGEEIPAFALTEPSAGSDAGGMTSNGVVFKGEDGELYIRLNWNKRYITLAAISTVLGLAFKLHDPENLLGKGKHLGITCALIPTQTEGVVLGKRHDPMGVPFYNCPTRGHDVIIPVSSVIGGKEGVGKGWQMLMQSLAVGRGISLPAQSVGGAKMASRMVGAYATIRRQFGLNIGKFEGIEEPLARIGGYTYLMEAARRFTTGGLDKGVKPAIVTAIAKYNFTEMAREIINDSMDVVGGAGISRGPRNIFASNYISAPIAITVEGANILTRTLMIFGQGAIRCHPYVFKEFIALMNKDVKGFDDYLWKHIGHVVRNNARMVLLSLTRGYLAGSPVGGPAAKYYRKMSWTSATFAFLTDIALGSYGGALKMKEKISGRFADLLSFMYLGTATLRRFEAEGSRKEDRDVFEWAMQYSFYRIQVALEGILSEIKVPGLSWAFRLTGLCARINRIGTYPSDRLGHKVAIELQIPGDVREHLTEDIFIPTDVHEAVARYENTFNLISEALPIYKRLYKAMKARELPKAGYAELATLALEKGIVTKEEADFVIQAEEAREDAVQVDEFTLEEYLSETPSIPVHAKV